jgi:hypothetical protein
VCNNNNFSTSYLFLGTREQYNHGSGVMNYYTLDADSSTLYSKFRTHRPVFLPLNFIQSDVCRYLHTDMALLNTTHHLAAFAKLGRTAARRKPSEHREQMR